MDLASPPARGGNRRAPDTRPIRSVAQASAAGASRNPESNPEPALKQVGLDPDRYLTRRLDKALSGGERHRIELASVLSMKPKLAILDEPAAGIDMLSINHIIGIIRALKDAGGSVLRITHQEEVALIADRASQLCAGRIVFSGNPREAVDHFRGRTCVRCDGEVCGYVRP